MALSRFRKVLWGCGVAAGLGCGGGGGTAPPNVVPPAAAAIELTASGLSARQVTVGEGAQVVFTNSDSASHQVASNPHPQHTDCPELNGPTLAPGAKFTATLGAHGSPCGFHDHLNPGDARFQGSITVTPRSGGGGGGGGYY